MHHKKLCPCCHNPIPARSFFKLHDTGKKNAWLLVCPSCKQSITVCYSNRVKFFLGFIVVITIVAAKKLTGFDSYRFDIEAFAYFLVALFAMLGLVAFVWFGLARLECDNRLDEKAYVSNPDNDILQGVVKFRVYGLIAAVLCILGCVLRDWMMK